ncbi:MAG: MlaD family protein [Solirubrobacteraceae bacterium]
MRTGSALLRGDAARGLITFAVLGLILFMSFETVLPDLFSGISGPHLTAYFANTEQLKTSDPVREHGVQIGRIDSISRAPGANLTEVQMTVEQSALPLYRDASAEIAQRSLLAGSFYVNLDPGTPATGQGPLTIPAARTSYQVELENVIDFDRGAAKQGLLTLPNELAQTFSDPNVPAQSVATLASAAPTIAAGLGAVRGRVADIDLKAFISASNRALRAFDTPAGEVRGLVSGAAATVQTLASRQAALRFIFSQSPAIQTRIQSVLAHLQTTLRLANPLLVALRPTADRLQPTLTAFRPAIVHTSRLLLDARPLLHSLRGASTQLAAMARVGAPVLANLTPALNQLGYTVLHYMNVKDPETRLTPAESVGPFFSSWGGAAAETDANGHFFRFPASGGEGALSNDLPCRTYFTDPTAKALIACDSLSTALSTYMNYNPLAPVPGTTGKGG